MNSEPTDLDKRRGMAARKAVGIRRVLAEVEKNARELRDRQALLENELLSIPADSWPEAAAKARYILNLYAAKSLTRRHAPSGSRDRSLRGLCAPVPRELTERARTAFALQQAHRAPVEAIDAHLAGCAGNVCSETVR